MKELNWTENRKEKKMDNETLTAPKALSRRITYLGIDYWAEYTGGETWPWRLTSTEEGSYHGEVRQIEGRLFSANVFESKKGETYQHLIWTPITWG